jgi:hypothetical protein
MGEDANRQKQIPCRHSRVGRRGWARDDTCMKEKWVARNEFLCAPGCLRRAGAAKQRIVFTLNS